MRGLARSAMLVGLVMLGINCSSCNRSSDTDGRVPAGYPATYRSLIKDADREAALTIWSATDERLVRELLADFRKIHPRIAVDYQELSASLLQQRFLAASKAGRPSADFLWTSAMDLQIKLVNDGYAQSYASPEKGMLPEWANWKDQAWGITAEPIVMVYNRRLMGATGAPASHFDFMRLLQRRPPAFSGKVATYDPAASAVGYLYLSQDDGASRDIWTMIRGLGANRVRLFTTSEAIIKDVSSGRSMIGYNVVGSYAIDGMRRNPDLAVVLPRDYTLLMSRIAMIPARARHPNAAKLFLDYLLSKRGQRHLVAHSMPSVRLDLPTPPSLRQPEAPMRAIRVGPALLVLQDQLTRHHFMQQWQVAMAAGAQDSQARPTLGPESQ